MNDMKMQLDYDKQETSIHCRTQIRKGVGVGGVEQEREPVEGRSKCATQQWLI